MAPQVLGHQGVNYYSYFSHLFTLYLDLRIFFIAISKLITLYYHNVNSDNNSININNIRKKNETRLSTFRAFCVQLISQKEQKERKTTEDSTYRIVSPKTTPTTKKTFLGPFFCVVSGAVTSLFL